MKTKTLKFSIKIFLLTLLTVITFSCDDEKESCGYDTEQDGFPFSCSEGMDVAFLIDYTGSMGGAIDDIKSSVSSIATTIVTQSGGNYRLALSIFDETPKGSSPTYLGQTDYVSLPAAQKTIISTGASTDQYLTMMETFSLANQTTFGTQLAKLNGPMALGSGSGFAEPGGLLFDEILNNNFAGAWRSGITKLAIIITDAPAGGDDDINNATDDTYLAGLAATANTLGVQCILVTSLATSNYQVQLVDNNTGGLKLMSADLNNVAADIISLIENICINNDEM
ncbi:hypothetical protein SAMN05444411_10724 [Lutibacter oricola]|uniref:VWFA domain-containing protein n=1 Tax=Lutibacter oricola TaxID=762486 RepID=A0A1H3D207_9FLAO|nr:vWA domain-containing protein [Lutibacter oricola]SDX60158.1 hypothetical protein SAMN05444411_10724 [Lutibacter oricola]